MKAFIAAALALTSTSAAASAIAACQDPYIELPVTMRGTRPMISASIDGHPIDLVVDTGASFSMLTSPAADELKLPLSPAPYNFWVAGVGGDVRPSITTARQFTLADGKLAQLNVQFLVGGGSAGVEAAGLLGQNLWAHFDDEYDLANGTIRISRPKDCAHVPMAYWDRTRTYAVMNLVSFAQLGRMTSGYGKVNGHRIRITFDSGAATSALSFDAARRAGIDPYGPGSQSGGAFYGVGRRSVESRIVPVDVLELGGEKIEHTQIRLADVGFSSSDMLLGADFFLSHRIFVANSQNKIYFTYNGGPVFNLRPQFAASGPPTASPNLSAPQAAAASAGAAEDAPKDASAYARRGAASLGRGELADAIADLTRAHELAPDSAAYLFRRGVAYRMNRQPSLAMADLDAAVKLDPANVDARIARAELRLEGKQMDGAATDLEAADKLASKESDARLILAGLYIRVGAYDQAASNFDAWIRTHGDDARLERALAGRCWAGAMSGDDLDRATSACDSALRRDTHDPQAREGRGLVRLRKSEDARAITDFDAALAAQPKLAWALYGRALAEQRTGGSEAAKADFAAANSIRPKIADDARLRGLSH
ncbi:MAG: aspartyl protease family protein [Caulobacteraceae bacterium]|nr:aspartyl protease family protein [Caulobacteraceae bacterium]